MSKARDLALILAALWFAFLGWQFLEAYRAGLASARFGEYLKGR